jgi:hypothetical protein
MSERRTEHVGERRVEILEVRWVDSVGAQGWQTIDEARRDAEADDMVHRSVGWLIADEPEYVLLALSRRDSWRYVDLTLQIPRGAIVGTRILRRGKGPPDE